jgi:hypothetical protein
MLDQTEMGSRQVLAGAGLLLSSHLVLFDGDHLLFMGNNEDESRAWWIKIHPKFGRLTPRRKRASEGLMVARRPRYTALVARMTTRGTRGKERAGGTRRL